MSSTVPDGLLLVGKPRGVTSHDAVAVARRRLGLRRIGHTGTLDPAAEGLLILLIGAATKHQQELQGHGKSYDAELLLGAKTDTGDAEGRVVQTAPVPVMDRAALLRMCASLEGAQQQAPPAYSAIKVRGHPAYWWARRGAAVALPGRTIRIERLELLGWDERAVRVRVECSAGTYVRTLAETMAERLGTVGHLRRLVRTRIGDYHLADAVPLAWIHEAGCAAVSARIQPVAAAALR